MTKFNIEDELESTLEALSKVLKIQEEIKHKNAVANSQLGYLDRYVCDLEHDIELGQFDAIQMTAKYKELQQVLELRRIQKDVLYLYAPFIKAVASLSPSTIKKTKDSTLNVKTGLSKRLYTNRVSDERKEKIQNLM